MLLVLLEVGLQSTFKLVVSKRYTFTYKSIVFVSQIRTVEP